jgi:hypothetical protein
MKKIYKPNDKILTEISFKKSLDKISSIIKINSLFIYVLIAPR